MNNDSYTACSTLLGTQTYVEQGQDARKTHERQIQWLLQHRKVPNEGWDDARIKLLLNELSLMDSNNFPGNIGLGEREARIASTIVRDRHFGFGHGIGRSGDLCAVQPKAAGSSILNKLTNSMLLDLIQRSGMHSAKRCVLIPVATGMALTIVLLTLRHMRPSARYVIWPRIDQKSCFKSILTAGFEPIVIENVLEDDQLRTDVQSIEEVISAKGKDSILCVLTTTSCFAPRAIDKISDVAKLCKDHSIPHIINNAYGVQTPRCMNLINEADRVGRVDAVVQSTDKNFMVPVGGAVVASSDADFINDISQTYPGRASSTPSIDVFITLLSLGWDGYKKLQADRKEMYDLLKTRLSPIAEAHSGRVLNTRNNPISLDAYMYSGILLKDNLYIKDTTDVPKVVAPGTVKVIGSHQFNNWGSHSDHYPHVYLTVAASIGLKVEEIDSFCKRFDKALAKFKRDKTENVQKETKSDTETN